MKKLIILVTALCLLLALTGCASSQPTEVQHTAEEGGTTPDNSASFSEDEESSTEQEKIISDDTDRDENTDAPVENTDAPAATDPGIAAPEETAPVEVEVHIGDSLLAAGESLENIIDEYENAVLWKDSKGYHVACAGEDGDTIYALVSFSEDLELLEAVGLEPIDPPQMEEWLGKTEEEFIALYGPYHFQPGPNRTSPASIAKDGNIYWREVENRTIVGMHSYSIDNHHRSNYKITDLEEPDVFEYEVHIGDSLYLFNRSLESSIDRSSITIDFDYSMWRDSEGYHIACRGEDKQTIYAIVWFSEDLELLEAEGLEPIEPLTQMEEWLGKTEEEFIAQYGPCHFVAGSGTYMPSYIAKDGTVFWMTTELGTIMSMHSYSIDRHHNSIYSLYF